MPYRLLWVFDLYQLEHYLGSMTPPEKGSRMSWPARIGIGIVLLGLGQWMRSSFPDWYIERRFGRQAVEGRAVEDMSTKLDSLQTVVASIVARKEELEIIDNIKESGNCDTIVRYSTKQICMPSINGWREVSRSPYLQDRMAMIQDTAHPTLAFYITDKDWEIGEKIKNTEFSDYIRINAANRTKEVYVEEKHAVMIRNGIAGGMTRVQLSDIEIWMDNGSLFSKAQNPLLIDTYKDDDNPSYALTTIMQRPFDGYGHVLIATMNICIVKERIIMISHYYDYTDNLSVTTAKANSRNFIHRFYEVNK